LSIFHCLNKKLFSIDPSTSTAIQEDALSLKDGASSDAASQAFAGGMEEGGSTVEVRIL